MELGQRVIKDETAHEEGAAQAGNVVGKDRAERTQSSMALICCNLVTLKSITINKMWVLYLSLGIRNAASSGGGSRPKYHPTRVLTVTL